MSDWHVENVEETTKGLVVTFVWHSPWLGGVSKRLKGVIEQPLTSVEHKDS